ncbi:MAG: hypothetical protein LBL55_07765 [Propionibacteriaceae bacterium]|nr:hypothetical protein [Propionibacteriaceae bacterium]
MTDVLRERFPDQFVYAEWGYGRGLLVGRPGSAEQFKRAVEEAGALAVVLEANLPTEVEQLELVGAVTEQVVKHAPNATSTIGYDYRSNSVEVTISAVPDLDQFRVVLSRAVDSAVLVRWGVSVRVEVDPDFRIIEQSGAGSAL